MQFAAVAVEDGEHAAIRCAEEAAAVEPEPVPVAGTASVRSISDRVQSMTTISAGSRMFA